MGLAELLVVADLRDGRQEDAIVQFEANATDCAVWALGLREPGRGHGISSAADQLEGSRVARAHLTINIWALSLKAFFF